MTPQIDRQFREIEKLLSADQYDAAEEALDAVDDSCLDTEARAYRCILRSEIALYTGAYEQARISSAIEVLRFSDRTDLFGRAKFIVGWRESALGNLHESQEHLIEAYASFLRCKDYKNAARALNRLAYVQLKSGNTAAATSSLRSCLKAYSGLNMVEAAVSVAHNLAHVQVSMGQLREALLSYSRFSADTLPRTSKPHILYNIMSAIPHALKGDIKTARKTIAKAKPYLDDYPREKAIYFENLGLINILDGKYAQAEEALQQGLELSLKIAPESALVSQIKRLFGDLYVAMQQWDKAEKYTREGLKVAEKIGERIEIAACWRILARIENHQGNTDKAREWFRKAIELFSVIGANYELAVTRYLAGVSGLYQNGERQAFLWMAREYFAEEEVKPYLQKVDTALAAYGSAEPPIGDISPDGAPTIIAASPAMKKALLLARRVAPSNMTVLLTGETGTGKDLLARYIHHYSGFQGEFVPVNTAAIPNDLAEAELFGHCKGAFTSAHSDRVGLIEQADGGTLYLNEIADASPQFQAKLLEVIETRQVRRLGDNSSRPLSVRIIAATNHDLQQCVADGRFRLDLYHRLHEIPIHLPPLSERSEDIPALVEYFLGCGGCSCRTNGNAEAIERLGFLFSVLDYPGNVRELKYRVEELAMRSAGDIGCMVDLLLGGDCLSECEWLERILERTGWNRSQAARCLGLAESTVRKRIRRYSLSTINS